MDELISAPVRVVKNGEKYSSGSEKADIAQAPVKRGEPEVQLLEVEPSVYDIIFTCSCGERTTIRCHSVSAAPLPPPPPAPPKSATPPSAPKTAPTPPPPPAATPEPAAPEPSVSESDAAEPAAE